MKASVITLYICGGLMATAAVVGAIDYKAASSSKEFKTLYKEEAPVIVPVVVKEKEIDAKDFSRAAIDFEQPPALSTIDEAAQKETKLAFKSSKKSKLKNNKKINLKQYSRAPLLPLKEEQVFIDSLIEKK